MISRKECEGEKGANQGRREEKMISREERGGREGEKGANQEGREEKMMIRKNS